MIAWAVVGILALIVIVTGAWWLWKCSHDKEDTYNY
jgi:hypothetical protein